MVKRILVRAAGQDDPHAHTEVRKRPLPPKAPPRGWPELRRCGNPHHGEWMRTRPWAPGVCDVCGWVAVRPEPNDAPAAEQ